jgi:hypothetical protein
MYLIQMEELYDQLNNISMENDDTETYTDVYENYCRLQRTVTFLTNGGRVTEEWMEEHRLHILKYQEMFPNFSQTNQEIDDPDFRKVAQESEVLLSNLVQSIGANRFFNVKFYLMLNQHMIKMCQFIFTEDELELCMSKLSI